MRLTFIGLEEHEASSWSQSGLGLDKSALPGIPSVLALLASLSDHDFRRGRFGSDCREWRHRAREAKTTDDQARKEGSLNSSIVRNFG